MIDGAKSVIDANFHITQPECVRVATELYRENSDWLEHFLSECCEIGDSFSESSGDFYTAYREFCSRTGEYTRSTTDFYAAIDLAGFTKKRTSKGSLIYGVQLRYDSDTSY